MTARHQEEPASVSPERGSKQAGVSLARWVWVGTCRVDRSDAENPGNGSERRSVVQSN